MNDQETIQLIEQLADLKEKGLITDEEYDAKRQELLARIGVEHTSLAPVPDPAAAAAQRQQRINNAFLFEIIGGVLGFLGVGYIYVGRMDDGVLRLIGWWIAIGLMWTVISLLSMIVIGLCLIPVGIIVQFGVPIYSANQLRQLLAASDESPATP